MGVAKAASTTGERARTEEKIADLWVARQDVSGTEEIEGKVLPLRVCRFVCRFSTDLLTNGEKYFIRDIDGDYQVNNVNITGQGRDRFLELKCSSRGKD